jgi:6-phosphogluconolactonase
LNPAEILVANSLLTSRVALVLIANLFVTSALCAAESILYAGSYTSGTSKGIYAWRFDSSKGRLDPLGLVAATPQPAHIWASPDGKRLYAVNWEDEGGVSAFRIDAKSGGLTFLNRVSAKGSKPNQVVVDPSGRIAVSVNYNTGNVVAYRILADGKLSEAFYVDQHRDESGAEKRSSAKAHGVEFSPDGKYLFVAELGLDRVYSYRVDASKPTIVPADPPYVGTHAGAGPRRLQITHDGRFLYVNHETDGEVSVFAVENARLREVQSVSTLPAGFSAPNKTAEIIISADDGHLYVSNRGHDSIAVFAIDQRTGSLSLQANVSAGGRTPRNLRLDPTGDYLFSSNENSGTITVFKVDKATGSLTLLDVKAEIDTPGGLYFVRR